MEATQPGSGPLVTHAYTANTVIMQVHQLLEVVLVYPSGTARVEGQSTFNKLSMMCTMDAPQVLRSACVMLAALPTPWICTAQTCSSQLAQPCDFCLGALLPCSYQLTRIIVQT